MPISLRERVAALVQFTLAGSLVAACGDSTGGGNPTSSTGNSGGNSAIGDLPDASSAPQAGSGGQQNATAGNGGSSEVGGVTNLQNDAGDPEADAGAGEGVVCNGIRFVGSEAAYADLVAEHCREITHLTFSDMTWPADAPGLDELTRITGALTILRVAGLRSMAAFSHLQSVGNIIRMQENADLESLDGFESLTSVGDLEISGNLALESVSGLSNLETVNGLLLLRAPVKSLADWQLQNVGGLSIWETELTSLTGLEQLTSVGGGLSIYGNPALVSLSGLSNLVSVGVELSLAYNAVLEDVQDLENLTSIGGSVQIIENAALASIEPFMNWPADTVGIDLVARDNPNLPQCQVDALTAAQDNATCAECSGNDGDCN